MKAENYLWNFSIESWDFKMRFVLIGNIHVTLSIIDISNNYYYFYNSVSKWETLLKA